MYEIFLGNRLFGTTETKKEAKEICSQFYRNKDGFIFYDGYVYPKECEIRKNLQIKRRILLKTSSPTKQNYLKKVNKDLMRLSQLEIICPQRINPKTQVLISK